MDFNEPPLGVHTFQASFRWRLLFVGVSVWNLLRVILVVLVILN